jgi:hypothetical protein
MPFFGNGSEAFDAMVNSAGHDISRLLFLAEAVEYYDIGASIGPGDEKLSDPADPRSKPCSEFQSRKSISTLHDLVLTPSLHQILVLCSKSQPNRQALLHVFDDDDVIVSL